MFLFGKKEIEKGDIFINSYIMEGMSNGHKKMHMVAYNGDDTTCFKSAEYLKKKYGEVLTGAKITIEKSEYREMNKKKYVIKFFIDGKKVGVIFEDSDYYRKVMNGKLKSIYGKIVQENILNGRGKMNSRYKVELYVK